MSELNNLMPPLKWVGGKRKIVEIIQSAAENIESPFTYYEPFFGGGAIFFSLYSKGFLKNAHLNDVVPQVVNFYNVISNKDERNILKKEAKKIENKFNNLNTDIEKRKEQYINFRESFNDSWEYFVVGDKKPDPESKAKLAAQFLALNKLGFNGMYRVNSEGRFNIPMGSPVEKKLFDNENLDAVGDALSKVNFTCDDYSNVKPFKGRGRKPKNNLIFLDPPYIPNSKTANFTDYSVEGFDRDSHIKLSNDLSKLIENEHNNVIFTNNYNNMSLELFFDKNKKNKRLNAYKFNITKTISAKNTGRGNTEELLLATFPINNLKLQKIN
jgi:DNA adenine methylase